MTTRGNKPPEPVVIRPQGLPNGVLAASSKRWGGVSLSPYDSLNLGTNSGDDASHVASNRESLGQYLQWPSEPVWLHQVHGHTVVKAAPSSRPQVADAVWSDQPGQVCAVLAADCLPILLAHEQARVVAAVHAGWRGLAGTIIEQTLAALPVAPAELSAWLGPAIGPDAFEVDALVRDAFVQRCPSDEAYFKANRPGHWLADLYGLARRRLAAAGVVRVAGGHWCTYGQQEDFFSYRRDTTTGRMATLIWIV